MKIEELLAKIANGEKLTEEENTFIKDYREPKPDEGRVPKARLDEVIAQRKASEDRAAGLQSKLEEMEAKVEELTTQGMTEAEKVKRETAKTLKTLQEQVESLTKERDASRAKADEMEFQGKVTELAKTCKFTDIDYLAYKVKAAQLKLDDPTAVNAFVKGLEQTSPHLFESAARPGGGSADTKGGSGASAYQARIDELLAKPALSTRESQEVIDLQSKIQAETTNGQGGTQSQQPGGQQTA